MFRKIYGKIYEKELKKLNDKAVLMDDELSNKKEKLEFDYRIKEALLKEQYGLLEIVSKICPEGILLNWGKNKNEELKAAVLTGKGTIALYDAKSKTAFSEEVIYFDVERCEDCIGIRCRRYIHIVDIQTSPRIINEGNGSILMNGLIKYAKLIGASEIRGNLSPVDDEHKDRRKHFYEKFGFTIAGGKISKTID